MKARTFLCLFCSMRYHETMLLARIHHPLAAALYDLFLLPLPGFRGDATHAADSTVLAVERAILAALGVKSLEGRGDEESVARLARRAYTFFISDGTDHDVYRFPKRRYCFLVGPRATDVLAKLGG